MRSSGHGDVGVQGTGIFLFLWLCHLLRALEPKGREHGKHTCLVSTSAQRRHLASTLGQSPSPPIKLGVQTCSLGRAYDTWRRGSRRGPVGHEGWADAMGPGGALERAARPAPLPARRGLAWDIDSEFDNTSLWFLRAPILHWVVSCFFIDGFIPLRLLPSW